MKQQVLRLWALATVLLVPLPMVEHGASGEAALQGVGMGILAAAVGAVFLYAGQSKPDRGVRRATIAVAVVCGLLWFGLLR